MATLGRGTHDINWLESLLSPGLQKHQVVVASTSLAKRERVVDEIVEAALKRSVDRLEFLELLLGWVTRQSHLALVVDLSVVVAVELLEGDEGRLLSLELIVLLNDPVRLLFVRVLCQDSHGLLDLEKFLSDAHRAVLESLLKDLLTEMIRLLVKEVE